MAAGMADEKLPTENSEDRSQERSVVVVV